MEPEEERGSRARGAGPDADEPDPAAVTDQAVEALLLAALSRRAASTPRLRRVPFDTKRLTTVERRVLLAYLSTGHNLHHVAPRREDRPE